MRKKLRLVFLAMLPFLAVGLAASVALVAGYSTLTGVLAIMLLVMLAGATSATFVMLLPAPAASRSQKTRHAHEHSEGLEFRLAGYVDERAHQVEEATVAAIEAAQSQITRSVLTEITTASKLRDQFPPAVGIGTGGVMPSITAGLVHNALQVAGKNILVVGMGESALWLAYALPNSQLQLLEHTDDLGVLEAAITEHGLGKRVRVHRAPLTRPNIAHHYAPWFDTGMVTGPVDTIILGTCQQADYPALPLLAPLQAPGGTVVLPAEYHAEIRAVWLRSGWVSATANPVILTVTGAARSQDRATFGLTDGAQ